MDQPRIEVELPPTEEAPSLARARITDLNGFLGERRDDVLLLVSELVTNAVRHAGLEDDETVKVTVAVQDEVIRCEVFDPGPGFDPPAAPAGPGTGDGGWGMMLLETLSDDWGVELEDGSLVWFEMRR